MQIETMTVVKVGGAPILAIQPHLDIPSDDLLPELLTVHRPESDGGWHSSSLCQHQEEE